MVPKVKKNPDLCQEERLQPGSAQMLWAEKEEINAIALKSRLLP